MESIFVAANGVRLHVADLGGSGPPLVMLHSTGFGAWMWKPVAARLTQRFHVYAPEQRGHGDSEKAQNGYDFRMLAADMVGVFEALGIKDAFAIGHSSGGTTLATLAALYPGRIGRLMLVEPVLPRLVGASAGGQLGANPMAERARKRKPGFASTDAMYASFRGRPPFDTWTDEALRLYCEQGTVPVEGGVALKCPPEFEARFYEAVAQSDVMPLLQLISARVRTLWGERSTVSPAAARSREALLPGEARIVPGTTHFIPMEAPDVVASEALAFFREDAA